MPHADEGLKALIERFRSSPQGSAFVELTNALLARGHAGEALRVAEHGLQFQPASADGRAERAAALLALGRPRVAYVELRRALAIDGQHRRALRLLGRAYKDAGVPSRAAELLAKRFATSETAPSSVAFPPAAATQPDAPVPAEPTTLPPNLFSNLTVDLGLGAAVPEEVAHRPVEITQIIRRKGMPRPPRSASELVAIEGPIVDTTQPGQIVETETPLQPPPLDPPALAPLFDLGDEPLFQDATPFEVRPVQTQDLVSSTSSFPESDTVVESVEATGHAAPPPVDLVGDLDELSPKDENGPLVAPPPAAPQSPEQATDTSTRPPAPSAFDEPWSSPEAGTDEASTDPFGQLKTRVELDEPDLGGPQLDVSATIPPEPTVPEKARPTLPLAAAPQGFGMAAVERARVVEGRIVVVRPRVTAKRMSFAVIGAAAMLLYVAALALFGLDELRPWWSEQAPSRSAEVSSGEASPSAAARALDP